LPERQLVDQSAQRRLGRLILARTITITDEGQPVAPSPEPEIKGLGILQLCLLGAGVLFSEVAAVVIWWPAALVLAALFCFGFSVLIARATRIKSPKEKVN
jgi:hypothetical protein